MYDIFSTFLYVIISFKYMLLLSAIICQIKIFAKLINCDLKMFVGLKDFYSVISEEPI